VRSKSAIFVDAGFLLAVGGTQVAGTSLRSAVIVDYKKLIQGVLNLAAEHSGLEVLRVYWYDASKDALFTDQHKKIGLLPDVKVRLGRISFNGGQKGVDLKLGLDLVGIARHRAADIAYLMSGDDDLAEAVEEAQDLGMKVVLMGIDDPSHRLGVASVAEHLALRVDSIITLPTELNTSCLIKAVAATPRPTPTSALELEHAHPPAAPRPGPRPAPGPGPRPVPPGIPSALPSPVPSLISSPGSRSARSDADLVYSSGGPGQAPFQREESALDVAFNVGESVATSWYGSTTQGDLNELLADRPILPIDIDRVLLADCAQRIGEYKTDLQGVRRALREAFWEKLDQLI
jgi:uncharacterized LabA/DUF88 family protein